MYGCVCVSARVCASLSLSLTLSLSPSLSLLGSSLCSTHPSVRTMWMTCAHFSPPIQFQWHVRGFHPRFHYRWAREVDQDVVSSRLAKEMVGTEGPPEMAAQMYEWAHVSLSLSLSLFLVFLFFYFKQIKGCLRSHAATFLLRRALKVGRYQGNKLH